MEHFEYVAVLTSIIIGLGIAHLLQGLARLIQVREERVYGVHLAWVLHLFLLLIFWWWWEFKLGEVPEWTFQLYSFVLFYAVVLYLLCAWLFPPSLDEYGGYREYFHARRGWFFALLIAAHLCDITDSWFKGTDYLLSLGPEYLGSMALRLTLFVAAIFVRHQLFHAVLAYGALAYIFSWAVRQYESLG